MGKTLGLLLPGRAPARELAAELARRLAPDVDVVQAGALDDLPGGYAGRLPPELGPRAPEDAVWVPLGEGVAAAVGVGALAPRLQRQLERLEAWGADAVVVASTAALPPLRSRRPRLEPWRLLPAVAGALLPAGRLGVVHPPLRAPARYRGKWQAAAGDVAFAAADPLDPGADWEAVARQLAAEGVELVVLDELAYPDERRAQLERTLRRPVLRAASWVAAVAGVLLGGP